MSGMSAIDRGHFRLGALADDVEFALELIGIMPVPRAHENLFDVRLRGARHAADRAFRRSAYRASRERSDPSSLTMRSMIPSVCSR